MDCPDCENGMVRHPMWRAKASKDYGRQVPCQTCRGSGLINPSQNDFLQEVNAEFRKLKDLAG